MNDAFKPFINRDVITGVVCAASGAAIAATVVRVVRRRKALKGQEELSRFEYEPDPSNAQPDLWAEGTADTWDGTTQEEAREYVDLTKLYGPPGQFIGDAIEEEIIEAYTEVEQAAIAEANALVAFEELPKEEQDRLVREAITASSEDEEDRGDDELLAEAMHAAGVAEDPDDEDEGEAGEKRPNWGDPPPEEPDEGPAETEVTVHSVFAGSSGTDKWNYEEEKAFREAHPDQPHILHRDEYFDGEKGYDQHSVIYYQGDDLLADTDNHLVPNHERVVGTLRFGHGSGDPGLVFVRNDKLKADYEIALDPGTYQQARYGIEYENDPTELKHALPRRFPRE